MGIERAKVVVTGGCGFVGSTLVRKLCDKNRVVVADNLSSGKLFNIDEVKDKVVFIQGDIRDSDYVDFVLSGADYVFHMAAHVGNVLSIDNPYLDMEVNIVGTLNILEGCLRQKVKKLVYSGSSAVYGEPLELPITELTMVAPQSPYAVSKLTAEMYCSVYNQIHGLPVTILRYFNVYGLRQGHTSYANVIPLFFEKAVKGEQLTIHGDGKQTRDFVSVYDVADANILAALSNECDTFNICSSQYTSVNDMAKMILEITGSKSTRKYTETPKGLVKHSLGDYRKAERCIGYSPKVSFREGLEDYYACTYPRR